MHKLSSLRFQSTDFLILGIVFILLFFPTNGFAQNFEKTSSDGSILIKIESEINFGLSITVQFQDGDNNNLEHVNYDIKAIQHDKVILDEIVHDHDGNNVHVATPLESNQNIEIFITFNGLGLSPPYSGPAGEVFVFEITPDSETIQPESSEPTQSNIKKATKLTLDLIPYEIHENELITFSGRLLTDNQEPVSGVLVYIKDDDTFWKDDDISFAVTDSHGWFTVDVPAKDWDSSSGGASEVYAEFKGDSNYLESETPRQKITVYQTLEREPTKMVLEQLPKSSYFVGNTIVFSGKLTSFGNPVAHQPIKIREDDPLFPDSYLVSGLTDSGGRFRIVWDIDRTSIEREWEIYAKYYGNQDYRSSESTRIMPIITSPPLKVILDPITTIARPGETVEFSGKIVTSGPIPVGQRIVLVDEDWANWDDILANALIDSGGNFRVQWVVQEKDSEDRKFLAIIADFFSYGVASEANEILNSAEIGTVEVFAKFYDIDSLYKEEDSPIQILVLQTNDEYNEILLGLLSEPNKQQNTDLLLQVFEGEDISEQQLKDLLTIMLEEKLAQNNKIPTSQLTDLSDNDAEPLETMIQELSHDQTMPGIASFVDPNQDSQYYVNRYNQEPTYKKWFDDNFPEYDSIYEAVGLNEPESIPKIKPTPLPTGPSPEPAPKIKPTPEPEYIPKIKPVPESEPILPTSKSQKVYPCGEGTHEESGKCIPDLNSDWQIFENIQNWFNENIVKPIVSAF